MPLPEYNTIHAHEFSDGSLNPVEISLSTEFAFTVLINGSPYAEIACSGSDLEYFAIGHMLANDIIVSKNDIADIVIDEDKKQINIITDMNDIILERLLSVKFIASGCGQANKVEDSGIRIPVLPGIKSSVIIKNMHSFLRHSNNYHLTHGAHSSAIYSINGELTAYFEDIGRHNAIDKAIGFAVKNEISFSDKMIVSTGRLSSDIVHKSIVAGVPAVVSRSSTTTLGYEMAAKHNLILIGRVKPKGFVIYNGNENILCA
jgi:FdhD protein